MSVAATEAGIAVKTKRLAIIDVLRGVAIVAMAIYHLFWDLSFFGMVPFDVSTDPGWISFQHLIVASFLLLVGVSLVLAHGRGIRWNGFWRRFGILVAASLAVTAATYWQFPDSFVFFGILHAIALFSLLALPFIGAPLWAGMAIAAAVIALPAFVQSDVFMQKPLAWIGLWIEPPPSNDLVPFFPWFGFVLFGIVLARLVVLSPLYGRLARFQASSRLSKVLGWMGRWSLIIYLVHQPLLFGALYPIAARMTPEPTRQDAFVGSCQQSCVAASGREAYCTAYCACALDLIETGNLWGAVNAPQPTSKDRQSISDVTNQCDAGTPLVQ
jgi:uncharacterized membrane protein